MLKTCMGNEPILQEALDYLERRGIPKAHIRSITVDAEIGRPVMIDVSLFMHEEPEPAAEPPAPCARCGHQAHLHWDETPGAAGSYYTGGSYCTGVPGPCLCNRSRQLVSMLAGGDLDDQGQPRDAG